MLTLPPQWKGYIGGAIADHLLGQVAAQSLRAELERHLIGAALDLLICTFLRNEHSVLPFNSPPNVGWRIADMVFTWVPVVDDDAVACCVRLASKRRMVTVLTRETCEIVLTQLLRTRLRGRAPIVYSLQSYMSWREMMASADQHWPRGRAVVELLRHYNRRVMESNADAAILAEIPAEPVE